MSESKEEEEAFYGRTPIGQLIYDLGFTTLTDKHLARKHGLTLAKIRDCRAAFKRGFEKGKAEEGSKRHG